MPEEEHPLLNVVADYLRIDESEGQSLTRLIKAAVGYLKNADVLEPDSEHEDQYELYVIAVSLLVSHWNENRESVVVGKTSKNLEFSLQSIILQLK